MNHMQLMEFFTRENIEMIKFQLKHEVVFVVV